MNYRVLARKWRPKTFTEMVGQEHVRQALCNGLDNDRLHHAFLFTGTRGVGKTTIARILAKSLNCLRGVSSEPCCQCEACVSIDEGRFVDLIEVDAASRTKVDDTRELLDNVQYAPSVGRYKVYLIDEVHMLSRHSFNALLKTLEEPPPHVKFLLATTDPQQLPVTVLSRCLQFNLKRLDVEQIENQMKHILHQEAIVADDAGLRLLARAADGSMRDGLSLLDQAIAFGGGEIREAEVRQMLGTIENKYLQALLDALIVRDVNAVLATVEELAAQAPDFSACLDALAETLYRVALVQLAPEALDTSRTDSDAIRQWAGQISPEAVQLLYQISIQGKRDLVLAPDPRTGFEMSLLRMAAFRPLDPEPTGKIRKENSVPVSQQSPVPKQQNTIAEPTPGEGLVKKVVSGKLAPGDWGAAVQQLRLKGAALQLAMNCTLKEHLDELVILSLPEAMDHLASEITEKQLHKALCELLGQKTSLKIEHNDHSSESPAAKVQRQEEERFLQAEKSLLEDPVVHAIQTDLDGRIIPHTIRALNREEVNTSEDERPNGQPDATGPADAGEPQESPGRTGQG